MKNIIKTISIFSLVLLNILLLVSCTQGITSKVYINTNADNYSNIILSFDETIKPSSEKASDKNKNADITDKNVISKLQKHFQGKKPQYFKYENNLLKAFYKPEDMPQQDEKLVVLKGLPIYEYKDNKYNLIATTNNSLHLIFKDKRFILDESINRQSKTKTVQITYHLNDKNLNYGYKSLNIKVSKFEKKDSNLLIKYTYNIDKDSSFELYKTEEKVKNNLIKKDLDTNVLLFKKEVSKDTKDILDMENIYLLQINDQVISFSYDVEKENVFVVFGSKILSEQDNLNLYNWGFEEKQEWPGKQMEKHSANLYSTLLHTPSKKEAFGLIVNMADESKTKLTGDLKSDDLLKPALEGENKLKFLFITSDEKSDKNDTVKVYNLENINQFLEYLK